MSFTVQLTQDLSRVEPGSTVPVGLEIANRGDAADRFEIEVEGIDPGWIAVPVPSFVVEPGQTHNEKFFLKPPRDTSSLAGTYPFVVNLRSIETGETRSVQGALEIEPYTNLSLDVQPKRGRVSPLSKTTEFKVTAMNLGNVEQSLQLFAADNDNLFAFEFEVDQMILAPGQQRTVALTAAATKSSLLASSRLQNFNVSGHSSLNPAAIVKASGQIEQRALATPGAFLVVLLLLGLLTAWIALFPKPPTLENLTVTPGKTFVGQPVRIEWKTKGATSVKVEVGKWVQDRQMPNGSVEYIPDKPGDYAVEVTVNNGDQKIKDVNHRITVEAPPKIEAPVILDLSVDNKQINLGQSFMLNYKLSSSVVRAVLYPMQRELDVKEKGILLTADAVGKIRYTVKAFNSAGDQVESSVTANIIKLSKAKVVKFTVTPLELEVGGGNVAIDFTVSGAARIELVYAGQKVDVKDPNSTAVQETGHQELAITGTTTFQLVAYDAEDVAVSSDSVTVKVKKAPPSDASEDPATTGGGTGQ